jgi:hypothetical protein
MDALEFLNTLRGQYIMGQALWLAIQTIEARPKIEREPSNVADMRFLMQNLFPMYRDIMVAQKELQAYRKKMEKETKTKYVEVGLEVK